MSIVTTLLGKLTLIGALSSRAASIESRLKLPSLPNLAHLGKAWFSASLSEQFSTRHYQMNAYHQAQARFTIAR